MGLLRKKAKGDPSFIGEKEVKIIDVDGDFSTVHFTDGTETVIHNDLIGLILTQEAREGTGVTDMVRHVLSAKFVSEMADLGLEYYMVDHVSTGMGTLIHNLRETKIAEAFECSSGIDMKLSKIVK